VTFDLYEEGTPPPNQVVRLGKVANVTLDEIFDKNEEPTPSEFVKKLWKYLWDNGCITEEPDEES
jgi:hypothetical protein